MITRRDFIKTMSLLSGAVLAPVRWLGKWAGVQPAEAEEPEVGELYEGFVLLPEGAPVPSIINYPEIMVPVTCGVGSDTYIEQTAFTETYGSESEISGVTPFPIFFPSTHLDSLTLTSAMLMKDKSGEIYMASLGYGLEKEVEILVNIVAYPHFPRPYPIWSRKTIEPDDPSITLEKFDLLPSPGIMVLSRGGTIFNWIFDDVLYSLLVEPLFTSDQAVSIATSILRSTQ